MPSTYVTWATQVKYGFQSPLAYVYLCSSLHFNVWLASIVQVNRTFYLENRCLAQSENTKINQRIPHVVTENGIVFLIPASTRPPV